MRNVGTGGNFFGLGGNTICDSLAINSSLNNFVPTVPTVPTLFSLGRLKNATTSARVLSL